MVWKQDLAKLKQAFPDGGGPPLPPAKPKPKPVEVKDLNEEDAFFLAAMGAPAAQAPARVAAAPERTIPAPAAEASFDAELADLKGLKPLARNPLLETAPVVAPQKPVVLPAAPAPSPEPPSTLEAGAVEPPVEVEALRPRAPVRIQLAAGMAVEVDAVLDLRNHRIPDALGRLRDRLEDGALMGWRTLHVVLGEDEALRDAMLGSFAGTGGEKISRYAQAPIPMGGAQAWVLYY